MTKENTTIPMSIARIGRAEVLLTAEGDGARRAPVANIRLVVSDDELKDNPNAGRTFEMQDLAALEQLCKRVVDYAYVAQSVSFDRPEPVEPTKTTKKITKKASARRKK